MSHTHTRTHMRSSEYGHELVHMTIWQAICTYMLTEMQQANKDILFRRWIMWEYANTHTQMGQRCKWAPTVTEKRIPLWPKSPYSPSPLPPIPSWPMSQTISLPVQFNTHTLTLPVCFQLTTSTPYTQCLCLSHASTHTRTETWRVPCLTPGPRRSLVWRPVCVCLASNGPFKCRIFTADRAILGDSTHRGLNML